MKKIIASALALVMLGCGMCADTELSQLVVDNTSVVAAASSSIVKPSIGTYYRYADKLAMKIKNIDKYGTAVKFKVYVNGNYVKTVKSSSVKNSSDLISIYDDGNSYLKADTTYKVKITALYSDGSTSSSTVTTYTASKTYYTVYKNISMYKKADGKMVYSKKTSSQMICTGVLVNSSGTAVAGKSTDSYADTYIKLSVAEKNGKNANNEQLYKYVTYYIKNTSGVTSNRKNISKLRNTVVDYAVAMSKKTYQTYSLCGEYVASNQTISDCSGMTKLSYLQIGMYMEHYADAQANDYGKIIYDNLKYQKTVSGVETYTIKSSSSRVDYDDLEKGDLLFFLCDTNNNDNSSLYVGSGIGHVAMYIGNGKMVHFTAGYGIYNHPCRIENLASYESKLKVMRVVRYIY